jgi:ribosomal protein S6
MSIMHRIPGVWRSRAARKQLPPAEVRDPSIEEMRTVLTNAGVTIHKRWGAKRLAEEIAKLK